MNWMPTNGWREVAEESLSPFLRSRCELLLLRMRIERLAKALPGTALVNDSGRGRTNLRLWGLVASATPENRQAVRDRVRQAQWIYRLSSEYLHGRRAALVPPPAELSSWLTSVDALEDLLRHLTDGVEHETSERRLG
ncbi:hypothetical protein AB0I53_16910 [Saccharopolyspora sp. NPDC050389]|uniref:hypothetical protein n=1 Tax=Saccharopolyspora sp. NPDC050389 TaxID=3155516 RepID=UPI0033D6C516